MIIRFSALCILLGLSVTTFANEPAPAPSADTAPVLAGEPEIETAPPLRAIQIYSQDQLGQLIVANKHLQQVKDDDCQLVADIEARAKKMEVPVYQFLYGDMLAWGVCYDRDAPLGIHYIERAASQGLPAALEQLGRYYHRGILVQKNFDRAIVYLREAASLGNLRAQLELVEIFAAGQGSPYDYADAYRWLSEAVIADKATHQRAAKLLAQLATHMPPEVVAELKQASIKG
ncbi:sel1 repeat family protein [Corallincola luteus]|uniref:Sel1 repeat family protein n=1 Tax=Corallincola luteus TaxID=1775177 RepID=A0ABY2ARE9_9GAMM|nr:tetratricopeptide repeat protein [Corallincola luteus]TCI04671.1 sel1 repeat family protein [Corallincola luteus]